MYIILLVGNALEYPRMKSDTNVQMLGSAIADIKSVQLIKSK